MIRMLATRPEVDEAELAARAPRAKGTRTKIVIGCMFAGLLMLGMLVMVWTFLFRAESDPVYEERSAPR